MIKDEQPSYDQYWLEGEVFYFIRVPHHATNAFGVRIFEDAQFGANTNYEVRLSPELQEAFYRKADLRQGRPFARFKHIGLRVGIRSIDELVSLIIMTSSELMIATGNAAIARPRVDDEYDTDAVFAGRDELPSTRALRLNAEKRSIGSFLNQLRFDTRLIKLHLGLFKRAFRSNSGKAKLQDFLQADEKSWFQNYVLEGEANARLYWRDTNCFPVAIPPECVRYIEEELSGVNRPADQAILRNLPIWAPGTLERVIKSYSYSVQRCTLGLRHEDIMVLSRLSELRLATRGLRPEIRDPWKKLHETLTYLTSGEAPGRRVHALNTKRRNRISNASEYDPHSESLDAAIREYEKDLPGPEPTPFEVPSPLQADQLARAALPLRKPMSVKKPLSSR